MTMHYQPSDPIILGSGELYLMMAKDIVDLEELTEDEELELVNIGAIESGATIDISNTTMDLKSANRGLLARIKTGTEVRFNTGIMTWQLENISKFLTGSKYHEDENGKKMIIGKDDHSPSVYLRFVHQKRDGSGELIVNMYKAVFDGDLNFVFDTENPTTVNYEFIATTNDDGNYVEFVEVFDKESMIE